jgi:hypothetical protein
MNNQEARKAAIKVAYGEYFDRVEKFIDDNGFLSMETWHNIIGYNGIHGIDIDSKNNIRPGDLIGIETNNGWVRLESGDDLPRNGEYWTRASNDGQVFLNLISDGVWRWKNQHISHYQLVSKPSPPVY